MRDESVKMWDRQPGEGRRAYEAFCIFRDMGQGRSLPKVSQKLAKSLTIVKKWSFTFNWQARADAWDASITEEARRKAAEDKRKMIDRQIQIGQLLQTKAANAVSGRDLDKASFGVLAKFIKLGAALERSARELTEAEAGENRESITFTFSRDGGKA